jgi:hypothetical protein
VRSVSVTFLLLSPVLLAVGLVHAGLHLVKSGDWLTALQISGAYYLASLTSAGISISVGLLTDRLEERSRNGS